ncbi:MAG: glycosyltransferase [Acidobacteriota bacterium]
MGKRILIATTGSLGDLHPYMAVALELQARGHSVRIATANTYQKRIERAGIAFAPMGPHLEATDTEVMSAAMDLKKGPEFLLRRLLYPAIPEAYLEVRKALAGMDLLLTHALAHAAHIAAEKTGVRWISTVLSPTSFFSRFDPPVPAPYPFLGRLRTFGPRINGFVQKFGRRMTRPWMEPVTRFRARLGLAAGDDPVFEGQHSKELVLAMYSPILGGPQPDWPDRTVQTGFALYDEDEPGRALDPRVERFLDAGAPPVIFTLGSAAVHSSGDFYPDSVAAIRLLGCRAVLLTGENDVPRGLPPEIAAIPYARFSKIFPRASVVVHPGGIGTTAQALLAGKPMLVVPWAFDQPDNAARLVRLGVARSLSRRKYDGRRALEALEILRSQPGYATAAEGSSRLVAAEDGTRCASDEVERKLVA